MRDKIAAQYQNVLTRYVYCTKGKSDEDPVLTSSPPSIEFYPPESRVIKLFIFM